MNSYENQNIDDLVYRFIQGELNPEEEKNLYFRIKDNPENRKKLFRAKDLWDASALDSEKLNKLELEQWYILHGKLNPNQRKSSGIRELIKIAAIVILALSAGWFGRYYYALAKLKPDRVEQKTVEVSKGQMKEVFLADGTHVWLNSDSKLSFPSGFSSNNRTVELRGEAFFEVTANKEKPFLVKTLNHTVKVTGTKFNVCEYPGSKIIETTLVEGKVKIMSGNIIKDLLPGQQSDYNTETAQIRIGKADFEISTSWKDGRYEFRNEPISKVFQIIGRWWDVKIDYPETKLKNERISGVLRRYKPLEQHFEVIKQLLPIDYIIEQDQINITVN